MITKEIHNMQKLHHHNLVQIFEVMESLTRHFIVMEYAPGGELFHIIQTKGRFNEAETKFYFLQILSAIEHMASGKKLQ